MTESIVNETFTKNTTSESHHLFSGLGSGSGSGSSVDEQ